MCSELVLSKCSGKNTDAPVEHSGALLRFRDGSVTTREIADALIPHHFFPLSCSPALTARHNFREISHARQTPSNQPRLIANMPPSSSCPQRYLLRCILICLATAWANVSPAAPVAPTPAARQLSVVLPTPLPAGLIAGRLFIFIARTSDAEPRFAPQTSLFAVEVPAASAGQSIIIPATTPGFPEKNLADLPPGEYFVQAVFNILTEFHRADGHVIWAHQDQWEGQNFARSPGNLYSTPQKIRLDPRAPQSVVLPLDQTIPPIQVPPDTAWVQRIKFPSPLLSKFWGHPMYLGATILLPKDYAAHPTTHYPVIYVQNHFSLAPGFGFDPTPSASLQASWGRQRAVAAAQHRPRPEPPPGTPLTGAFANTETGQEFYESWNSTDFPRMIVVTFQHPTPYFDDSYGVNSPNCGPYGDAIMQELIPAIEARYRTIQSSYARVLSGSSTGGWGALALQIYYPQFFGGAWAFSPDPVDFRLYYGGVDLYRDTNAFIEKSTPGLAGGAAMNRRYSQRAAILGTQEGRFEWWKHTPVGPDGYPLPVWNLKTGVIDQAVVQAMRANNYDLRELLAREWPKLGPQLIGKIHVCAAATDDFYSNFAVRLLDEFMQGTQNPHDAGTFLYGPPGSRHGWRPTTNAEHVQAMAEHIAARTPAGENPAGWHY